MFEEDLALNNLQWLIYHETQPIQDFLAITPVRILSTIYGACKI